MVVCCMHKAAIYVKFKKKYYSVWTNGPVVQFAKHNIVFFCPYKVERYSNTSNSNILPLLCMYFYHKYSSSVLLSYQKIRS